MAKQSTLTAFGFTVTSAMQQVFNAADTQATDWALTLQQEGLTTRAEARPFVVIWAGAKYGVAVEEGQRGLKLPQDSAASKAVDRVLKAVFSADETPAEQKSSGSQDPVAALLKKFAKLSAAQKRAFKAAI